MRLHPELSRGGTDGGRREAGGSRSRSSRWGIGVTATLALGLAALSVFILLREMGDRPAASRVEPPVQQTPIPLAEYPWGSPTDADPYRKPEAPPNFGGEYPRWNLKELPEGWDPAIAKTIHAYFEAMTVSYTDEEKLAKLRELREAFQAYLDSLGPEAVPTLAAILNAEGDFVNRRFILDALGNLGPESEAATFVLADFFMARHGDPRNRSEMIHAIDAMANLKNETSFGTLKDFIADPSLEGFRRHFVSALGEHPRREEAVETFVEHLHGASEPDINVRNMAAQALGKVRSLDTLNDLYRAAQEETYFAVKQTILGSIGKVGNPNSVPFLEDQYRQALGEPQTEDEIRKRDNVRIRQSAARAISRIDTPYSRQVLGELARTEPDPKTRQYMEQWIAELDSQQGR